MADQYQGYLKEKSRNGQRFESGLPDMLSRALERTMTEWPDIRRLESGAIDYDFYRARAHLLRNGAMRDAFRPRNAGNLKPVAVALIAAMALLVLASTATP